MQYAPVSDELLIVSLIYADKLIARTGGLLRLSALSVHRLILSCLLVAIKFYSDAFYSNAYLANIGGVPTRELNALERLLLLSLDFDLVVSSEHFRYLYVCIVNQVPLRFPLRLPTRSSHAWSLEKVEAHLAAQSEMDLRRSPRPAQSFAASASSSQQTPSTGPSSPSAPHTQSAAPPSTPPPSHTAAATLATPTPVSPMPTARSSAPLASSSVAESQFSRVQAPPTAAWEQSRRPPPVFEPPTAQSSYTHNSFSNYSHPLSASSSAIPQQTYAAYQVVAQSASGSHLHGTSDHAGSSISPFLVTPDRRSASYVASRPSESPKPIFGRIGAGPFGQGQEHLLPHYLPYQQQLAMHLTPTYRYTRAVSLFEPHNEARKSYALSSHSSVSASDLSVPQPQYSASIPSNMAGYNSHTIAATAAGSASSPSLSSPSSAFPSSATATPAYGATSTPGAVFDASYTPSAHTAQGDQVGTLASYLAQQSLSSPTLSSGQHISRGSGASAYDTMGSEGLIGATLPLGPYERASGSIQDSELYTYNPAQTSSYAMDVAYRSYSHPNLKFKSAVQGAVISATTEAEGSSLHHPPRHFPNPSTHATSSLSQNNPASSSAERAIKSTAPILPPHVANNPHLTWSGQVLRKGANSDEDSSSEYDIAGEFEVEYYENVHEYTDYHTGDSLWLRRREGAAGKKTLRENFTRSSSHPIHPVTTASSSAIIMSPSSSTSNLQSSTAVEPLNRQAGLTGSSEVSDMDSSELADSSEFNYQADHSSSSSSKKVGVAAGSRATAIVKTERSSVRAEREERAGSLVEATRPSMMGPHTPFGIGSGSMSAIMLHAGRSASSGRSDMRFSSHDESADFIQGRGLDPIYYERRSSSSGSVSGDSRGGLKRSSSRTKSSTQPLSPLHSLSSSSSSQSCNSFGSYSSSSSSVSSISSTTSTTSCSSESVGHHSPSPPSSPSSHSSRSRSLFLQPPSIGTGSSDYPSDGEHVSPIIIDPILASPTKSLRSALRVRKPPSSGSKLKKLSKRSHTNSSDTASKEESGAAGGGIRASSAPRTHRNTLQYHHTQKDSKHTKKHHHHHSHYHHHHQQQQQQQPHDDRGKSHSRSDSSSRHVQTPSRRSGQRGRDIGSPRSRAFTTIIDEEQPLDSPRLGTSSSPPPLPSDMQLQPHTIQTISTEILTFELSGREYSPEPSRTHTPEH